MADTIGFVPVLIAFRWSVNDRDRVFGTPLL